MELAPFYNTCEAVKSLARPQTEKYMYMYIPGEKYRTSNLYGDWSKLTKDHRFHPVKKRTPL